MVNKIISGSICLERIISINKDNEKPKIKFDSEEGKSLLLNFEKVPYLDSTGLGEVVRSYTSIKNKGGVVKIVNLTNKVKDLLSVTKLITVFETFEDEEKAVASF